MEQGGEAQGDEMVKKAESILKSGKLKSMKGPSKQTRIYLFYVFKFEIPAYA